MAVFPSRLNSLARLSVARGCGFGMVAIITMMVGLSEQMPQSLQAGGYAMLLMCMVLLLKAFLADQRPYKRTELWLLLAKEERPREQVAQKVVATVLRQAYLLFAKRAALAAIALLVGSQLLRLLHAP